MDLYIHYHCECIVFMTIIYSAVAEKAWTYENNTNWKSFQERLSKQYVRLKMIGINYRMPNLGIEERINCVFTINKL